MQTGTFHNETGSIDSIYETTFDSAHNNETLVQSSFEGKKTINKQL